jgi:hypothetical protein
MKAGLQFEYCEFEYAGTAPASAQARLRAGI